MKTMALNSWTAAVVPSALLAAGCLFAGTGLRAAEADSLSNPAVVTATNSAANDPAQFPPGRGLRFNFRQAPLSGVLGYLSSAAGFIIHPQVSISGQVDAFSDQPMSADEALQFVEHVLADNGYAVIRDGRILTILSASEAKRRDVPVNKFTRLEDIPHNAEVATWIIPVRTLNPVALVSNLRPLMNSTTDLQANESANSLLVTDSQDVIRRIAEIVVKLDSVSSSINSIEVMPIKFADAKAIAELVKQLYPSQSATGGAGAASPIAGFFGAAAGGGFGSPFGGASTGAGAGSGGSAPGSRVTAVSDDHSNSLIVSAPDALLPTIRELVRKLDQQVDDLTEVRSFQLKHADANEMATMLGSLFPDTSGSTDASQTPFQFGGGAAFGFAAPASTASTGPNQYMKKMAQVAAVPDPRTQSVLVSASKDVMPQIEGLIAQLDALDSGILTVHRINLKNADPQDVMQLVQDLYPQGSTSTKTVAATSNPLLNRATTLGSTMLSSGPGSGSTASTGASSGSGSGSGVATGF